MANVFISTWPLKQPEARVGGIGQYTFDAGTGELRPVRTLEETVKLNVTCFDARRNVLYALDESPNLPSMRAGGGGRIFAYRFDPDSGESERISCTPTCCANPVDLALDATGRFLVVANHGSRACVTKVGRDGAGKYCPAVEFDDAAVELFAVGEDGAVGELLDVVRHTGSGPHAKQTNAHPHSATVSPSGALFAVCDKGSDQVYMYTIDRERGELVVCTPPYLLPPGTMPRSCTFHPALPYFYHNTEGSLDVWAYRYDEGGALSPIGRYNSLLPDHVRPEGKPYEQQGLCMHPSGQFLYTLLNGPDMVAVFRVSREDGALTLVQNQPVGHAWPRGAALSADGRFLVVTCMRGNRVVVFAVGDDGGLTPTGNEYEHPAAAYATFW